MKADQKSGTTLVGAGDQYMLCPAGATTSVKASGGRIIKIIPLTGTGTVAVYDNNAGDASGQNLWPATAQVLGVSGIVPLDIPTVNGISVVVAAATTCLVVFA